jgi:hypothetical protein
MCSTLTCLADDKEALSLSKCHLDGDKGKEKELNLEGII